MGYCAYTVDRNFRIEAADVAAALAEVNAASGGAQRFSDLVEAIEEVTCFQDCEIDESGAFVLGDHVDKFIEATEILLTILGRFACEGSYVRFDGEDGSLFGYRVVDGELRGEAGAYVWTLDSELPAK